MSIGTWITLAFALFAIAAGLTAAFRQRLVRGWYQRLFPTRHTDEPLTVRPEGDDPVHYALIIAGVMLAAFGLLIGGFTLAYELMTTG